MTRSRINICLLAVISLLFGVIWQGAAYAAAPTLTNLGQIDHTFREAAALALDGAGNLYVSDMRVRAVYKFDKYGKLAATFPVPNIKGEGLAVDAGGHILVSASSTATAAAYGDFADKVLILDSDGVQIGVLGQGTGEFKMAGDIDFDANGNIYVADRGAGIIKVYPPTFGAGVQFGALHFDGSIDLAVDALNNEIYIANYNYDVTTGAGPALYAYDAGAVQLRSIPADTGFGGDSLSRFGAIEFDSAGRFYVSDFTLHSIRVLDRPATQVLKYTDNIHQTGAMAFDAITNRLFALDYSSRINIIGIDGGSTPLKVNAPPSVPVSITVGEVSSATPTLRFNNAIDADGDLLNYEVRVVDAAGVVAADFNVAEGAGQTSAPVSVALVENASYTWQVQASDGQATSGWSAPMSIYVNAVQEAPTAPVLTTFISGNVAGSDAVLTWDASVDADPFATISYRVEVSDGLNLVASADTTATSIAVATFSATLNPDVTYTWKVLAVDNTALTTASASTGSFVYQPSALRITSTVDGAKVYLGGHHGYAGRSLGTAPVDVRGLPQGNYAVVVEAAGFEPFVQSVFLAKDASLNVLADLRSANLPDGFAQHDLNVGGVPFHGAGVAPIVADIDHDGVLDLLVADGGHLKFYGGTLVQNPQANDTIEDLSLPAADPSAPAAYRVVFNRPVQQLALPLIDGAAPCLVDWNNDDNYDLLVGASDGSVNLFLGQGGLTFAAEGQWLVTTTSRAIPAVADFDGDGDKDLIVGSGNDLLLFENVGTDAAPSLNTQKVLATLTAPVVPLFVDWNADGLRELMLLSQGEMFSAELQNGLVTALKSTGLSVAGAESVFALNFADRNYNDLVFGTSAGALVVANGQQGATAPAFMSALLVKLAEIEQLVLSQAPAQGVRVEALRRLVSAADYGMALPKSIKLVSSLKYGTPAWVSAVEFIGMLDPAAAQAVSATAALKAVADDARLHQNSDEKSDDKSDNKSDHED
ncbi:FG-GAP-like repeat-containing protein [Geopsychrobacter electrodiphilus]|uniref:FG-GAP-like repeat-containing protein n=1 Tax=Geopsychrobacter electrodiphilus TaxID=225196 RepID=UPI000378B827|nr:FG-GAP-like repeat-containing protein [Geopsychrobacter electrodiphilus]